MNFAEQILSASDLIPEPVGAIPEWQIAEGVLFQRGMTGQERREWELLFVRDEAGERPDGDPRAAAVAKTLCDASGRRVFSNEQIPALAAKSAAVLEQLYDNAARLSGISTPKGGEETARKNSGPTDGTDSSIG